MCVRVQCGGHCECALRVYIVFLFNLFLFRDVRVARSHALYIRIKHARKRVRSAFAMLKTSTNLCAIACACVYTCVCVARI